MSDDVLGYLHRKGLATKRASADEVHVACLFCNEDDRKRGRLYINVNPDAEIPGLHFCHLCGAKGSLVSLQKYFGDATERQEREDTGYKRRQILQLAADHFHEALDYHPEVVRYLVNERGLSPAIIAKHKLGFAGDEVTGMFQLLRERGYAANDISATGLTTFDRDTGRPIDFLHNHITIPYMVAGNVVMIRGRAFGASDERHKYVTGPGQKSRLFNTDAVWDADEVVLCEGEFDCMVLEEQGYQALAVPGANTWQDAWDGYFTDVKRIWVVFDRDPEEVGAKAAERLVSRFGAKARRVELPEHEHGKPKNDITEWFVTLAHSRHDFDGLLKAARGTLISVTDAIAAHSVMYSLPGLKFGIALLDNMIKPGLLPSQVMVLNANTGCIQGDVEIALNRAGKGFKMALRDVVTRFNGGHLPRKHGSGKSWDLSIPTMVQREVAGEVRLVRLKAAWCSGLKQTYTVTTDTGRSIRATDEHPFLTERGWLRLDQLVPGDLVHVRGSQGGQGRGQKLTYSLRTVPLHPFRGRRNIKMGGNTVPFHRLVAEAQINALLVEEYLTRCRIGPVAGLQFLDPKEWSVHHIDHDPTNNDPANLKVLTPVEHHRLHAAEGNDRNVRQRVAVERVVSVVPYGVEETYDLEVEDDPHNFIANGFVVHNTGKTLFLMNAFRWIRMAQPDYKILFLSLEQTAHEWWERARRIHRFFNVGSTDVEAETFYAGHLWLDERNRVSPEQLLQVVDDFQIETGSKPDLVAIDYLGYWARSFKGERYERTSEAIMTLKEIAKSERLRMLTPHQVSRSTSHGTEPGLQSGRDSGVVEETADFLLTIWRPDTTAGKPMEEQKGDLNMSIAKSRHGGQNWLGHFVFAPLSLAIVPIESGGFVQMARNEYFYRSNFANEDWQHALIRHQVQPDLPMETPWSEIESAFNRKQQRTLRGMR